MLMTRRTLTALTLVALAALPVAAGQGQSSKWWQSDRIKRELGLTEDQSARIEQVFQATLPQLQASKKELDQLEGELSKLIKQNQVEEAEVSRLIDRVEAARSHLSKLRTLMLFRMHRVLTAEQRQQLREMQHRDRRRPDHR